MPIQLERRYRFSAAHRYHRPEWSDAENQKRFGKCNLAPGHGHNYRLTVWIEAEPDPLTGFVTDLGRLDALVAARILERVDHRFLNESIDEFGVGRKTPTTENLVAWIRDELSALLSNSERLTRLRLEEDEDLAAIWFDDRDRGA